MVPHGSIHFHMDPRFYMVPLGFKNGSAWFHMIPLVYDEDKKGVCNRGGGYIWLHPPLVAPATPAQGGHLPSWASMLVIIRLICRLVHLSSTLICRYTDRQVCKSMKLQAHLYERGSGSSLVTRPDQIQTKYKYKYKCRQEYYGCSRAQSLGLACPLDQHCQ